MQTIPVGPALLELLVLAYRADQPVLLHGRHGVGKSAVLAEAAAHLGIGLIVRDLSLMEPPDLLGIPRVGEDGRTHYAVPAFLPQTGRGLLVFEELNRCPRYMAAPCLQLLTARQLNDYALPAGWLPCAAINDAEEGYGVEELDAALLSRFLQVSVVPEVTAWVQWARTSQQVHEKVISFVAQSPGILTDPVANPRAWCYASQLLTAWEAAPGTPDLLAAALAGVVGGKVGPGLPAGLSGGAPAAHAPRHPGGLPATPGARAGLGAPRRAGCGGRHRGGPAAPSATAARV
jgi:hypothetical protein